MQKFILFFLVTIIILITPIATTKAVELEVQLLGQKEVSSIPEYFSYIFVFGISIVGIVAILMVTLGAIQYIVSAGNVAKKDEAKTRINRALIGMGLLLISYILLNTINPDLVKLKNPSIDLKLEENLFQNPSTSTSTPAD